MDDYRGYLCEIEGKVFRCVGQDFFSARLWLELPAHLAHLDSGHCTVPTFEVNAYKVRKIDKDEEAAMVLQTVLADEKEDERYVGY